MFHFSATISETSGLIPSEAHEVGQERALSIAVRVASYQDSHWNQAASESQNSEFECKSCIEWFYKTATSRSANKVRIMFPLSILQGV